MTSAHDENEVVEHEESEVTEAAEETSGRSAFKKVDGSQWYIVHTYSGYEHKARIALEERIRSMKSEQYFEEVLVPEENVVELVKGKKRTTKRRFFPGYILVKMILNEKSWHVVKDTPKVTGFVGDKVKPMPVS